MQINTVIQGDNRVVVWYSCGACSFLALELAIREFGSRVIAVYCDTGGEHPDNKRFLSDTEKYLGITITVLKNPKYDSHFDVYEKTKFLISPQGARCTGELKKQLRYEFERPDDIQVFGYAYDERHRAERFKLSFPDVQISFPLIKQGYTKQNAIGHLWQIGIKMPEMYALGYKNNNCIGCVKGGMGYWNKIRRDFPLHFNRMSKIERSLNVSINDKFLDELNGHEGNYHAENISCDFICQSMGME